MTKLSLGQFETRLLAWSALICIPPVIFSLLVMLWFEVSPYLIALSGLCWGAICGYGCFKIYSSTVFQLRTLSNLLEAISKGDFTLRGRVRTRKDALGELVIRINALAEALQSQRFMAQESQLLLVKVINQIDVAILAVDDEGLITLSNPAAQELYGRLAPPLQGRTFEVIGGAQLEQALEQSVAQLSFPARKGEFTVVREFFREGGRSHRLFFITDVRVILRARERQAWQNLVRVLSHEINNSLAPIASISETLQDQSRRDTLIRENLHDGLSIIAERAHCLQQFIRSYGELSRLPDPDKSALKLHSLVEEIRHLFPARNIDNAVPEDAFIKADPLQLRQVLINIVKNADEAMPTGDAAIGVAFEAGEQSDLIYVLDEGTGIANQDNLFIPFYSTKPGGSGIGLMFCRQVVEAHGGFFSLANREHVQGCAATVELPR